MADAAHIAPPGYLSTKYQSTPHSSSKCMPSSSPFALPELGAHIPHLNAQHIKPRPLLAQRLVPERRTRGRDAVLEVVVEPEAVVAVAAADGQVAALAEDHEVVHPAVGEGFETDRVGCAGPGGLLCGDVEEGGGRVGGLALLFRDRGRAADCGCALRVRGVGAGGRGEAGEFEEVG